jgi:acyl transferase domain-containing protein
MWHTPTALFRPILTLFSLTNEDGRCYVFDDRGRGYSRGEGVGTLVLKRLDRAVADNDPIHAVIAGSGVNQDGKTQGIYLPNAESQIMLARSTYAKAGLDPCETLYVEAHGTGTQAGERSSLPARASLLDAY